MLGIVKKNFDKPDEAVIVGEKLKVETIVMGEVKIQKITAEPGWKWSMHLKPLVKTESCQNDHLVYIISGRLASQMLGGEVIEFGPSDVGEIPPGHDGWTVGNEPVVWLELSH